MSKTSAAAKNCDKPTAKSRICEHKSATFTHDAPSRSRYECCLCAEVLPKSHGYWNCGECASCICQSCRKEQTYLSDQCPAAHKLEFSDSNNGKYNAEIYECDNCGANCPLEDKRWHCAECSFDLCRNCKHAPPFAETVCGRTHSFTFNACTGRKSPFRCRYCMVQGKGARWFCNVCKHEICTKCKSIAGISEELLAKKYGIRGMQDGGVDVTFDIQGTVCGITLQLKYKNTTLSVIESAWTWPMDPLCAITGMSSVVEGVERFGVFMHKERAEERYDDAISSGQRSYMLEYDPDKQKLKTSIGCVGAGAEVIIRLKMVKMMEIVQGKWCLMYPMTSIAKGVPVSVSGSIKSNSKILEVSSASHEIVSKITGTEAKVHVKDWSAAEPKTFLVSYDNEGDKQYPGITLQRESADKEEFAYQISVTPKFSGQQMLAGEYLFVLDKSGSMAGRPIKLAVEACEMFLHSLPAGSFFNIYYFDDKFRSVFPESAEYSEENMQKAVASLKRVQAKNGTNIYKPLNDIFSKKAKLEGRARQLLLLTDGAVLNKDEVVKLIQDNAENSRVYSFGIGNGVDRELIQRTAKAGRGKADFIQSGEAMTPKIIRALELCVRPALENVKLTWPAGIKPKHQTPISEMSSGGQFCIFGIAEGKLEGEAEFVAINPEDHSEIRAKLPLSSERVLVGTELRSVAIAQLFRTDLCSAKTRSELSLEYQVLCDGTAIFLKEKPSPADESAVGSEMVQTTVKELFTGVPSKARTLTQHGGMYLGISRWCGTCMRRGMMRGGFRGGRGGGMTRGGRGGHMMTKAKCRSRSGERGENVRCKRKMYSNREGEEDEKEEDEVMETEEIKREKKPQPGRQYTEIAMLQKIEGFWTLPDIASFGSVEIPELKKTVPHSVDETVWATLLALSVLKTRFAGERMCWKLVELKALSWLRGKGIDTEAMRYAADKVISDMGIGAS